MYTLEELISKLVKVITIQATVYRFPLTDNCVKNTRYAYLDITDEIKNIFTKGTIVNIYNTYDKVASLNAAFKIDNTKLIVYNKFRDTVYKNPVDSILEDASAGEDEVTVPNLDYFFVGRSVDIVTGANVETKEVLDFEVQDEGVRKVTFKTSLENDVTTDSLIVHKDFQAGFIDVKCKTIFGTPDSEFYTVEPSSKKPYTALLVRAISLVGDKQRDSLPSLIRDTKKGILVKVDESFPYKLRLRFLIRSNSPSANMTIYTGLSNVLGQAFGFQVGDNENCVPTFIRKDTGSSLDFIGDANNIVDSTLEYEGIIRLGEEVFDSHKLLQQINFIFTKYNSGV